MIRQPATSRFLSTLSLRRATIVPIRYGLGGTNFYPRSPCGERHFFGVVHMEKITFLSTLSLRRATLYGFTNLSVAKYFYPRSPCGERPRYSGLFDSFDVISIHALLAESDGILTHHGRKIIKFLSTLSLRRATTNAPA